MRKKPVRKENACLRFLFGIAYRIAANGYTKKSERVYCIDIDLA